MSQRSWSPTTTHKKPLLCFLYVFWTTLREQLQWPVIKHGASCKYFYGQQCTKQSCLNEPVDFHGTWKVFTLFSNTIFSNQSEFVMISTTEDLVAVARSDVVNFSEELCFCVGSLLPVSQASSARMYRVHFLRKAPVNTLPMLSPDSKQLHIPHPNHFCC